MQFITIGTGQPIIHVESELLSWSYLYFIVTCRMHGGSVFCWQGHLVHGHAGLHSIIDHTYSGLHMCKSTGYQPQLSDSGTVMIKMSSYLIWHIIYMSIVSSIPVKRAIYSAQWHFLTAFSSCLRWDKISRIEGPDDSIKANASFACMQSFCSAMLAGND